jgi:NAD+ synthase
MSAANKITEWLNKQVAEARAQGLVFGLSGGIDSACVSRLSQLATPNSCLGVIMPCHSNPQDEKDALLVASHFQIQTIRVPLEKTYDTLRGTIEESLLDIKQLQHSATDDTQAKVSSANIKPRLRMSTLYLMANRLNYLVAGTGNRSEIAIGYYTKYGDGGVDLLPIGQLVKREVQDLASELGVPSQIIEKTPSAGLWLGQTDEKEMGFTYEELEQFLNGKVKNISPEKIDRIKHLMAMSAHKRSLPPMPPS